MCKYSGSTNYKCPHESLKDSEYCIFHLQDDKKDVDEFNKRLKEILETDENLINFNGFYFPPNTDFVGTNFRNKVFFFDAMFSGKVYFTGAEFSEEANFTGAIFSGDADFRGTKFPGNVDFYNAKFSGEADFKNTKFEGDADFTNSNFSGNADFMMATFSGYAIFTDTTFSGYAGFKHSTFLEYSGFTNSNFSGNAGFSSAEFSEYADFRDAKFKEYANFKNAKFKEEADFKNAKFEGSADFRDAKFKGEANFRNAKFKKYADFRDAKFKESADFNNTKFTERFVFTPKENAEIEFTYANFSDNVQVKADLSKCSFANSNIERVDMTDSLWIVDNEPKNSYKIWEERQDNLSSKELEGIYRRLKQNYQKFGDNSTAGKFYYQEMECKRNQLRGFTKLFWNVFYKKLCGYGEKPFSVIWFSGLIILASSLFFFYWGIELLGSEILNIAPRLIDYKPSFDFQWVLINFDKVFRDWLVCLYTSVITFTTLGYGDVHPIGWSRIVASVEAGIGIIMTALFIFVFTRKMLR